jgi:hypothetical protein
MSTLDVPPDALLHLIESLRADGTVLKQRSMNVLGAVAPGPPNDDLAILLVPLEDSTRSDAKLLADLYGYRDLSLRGQSRMSECHHATLPG